MPVVQYKRTSHEVNCFLKYLLFVGNFFLWSVALLILAVGIWSWSEKDRFSNLGKITHLILDPAFVFVVIAIGVLILCGAWHFKMLLILNGLKVCYRRPKCDVTIGAKIRNFYKLLYTGSKH